MELVDTHAHIQHRKYADDLEAVLQRSRAAGVTRIVVASSDLTSSRQAAALAASHEDVFAAVGIHPNETARADEDAMAELAELALLPGVVAIGETGLDYHYQHSCRNDQLRSLSAHLELAERAALPIIIHDREAHEDVWAAVQSFPVARLRGVWHCFSGDLAFAERAATAGYYLGIGGILTFSTELAEVIRAMPLERIVLETDAPYLAPVPYRGQRNEPARTAVIAARIAEIKGCSLEEVAEMTTANAISLFGLA